MTTNNWTNISGILQGDISYSLRKILTTLIYIDFELTTFGEKWLEYDIAFEYRFNDKETWREDAVITRTTAKYLRGNKLYGLSSSKYGVSNEIRWKYSDNNLFYSNTPQIRLRVLPRIRVFSTAGNYHQISSIYGDSLVNFDGQSRHACIGINNDNQYMCIGVGVFYIIDALDAEEDSTSSSSGSSSSTEIRSSSSSSLSSSSSSYGYCNNTIYAEGFRGAYNGTYNIAGIYNDRPYWINESNRVIFWNSSLHNWYMAATPGDRPASNASISNLPCPYNITCTQWSVAGGGPGIVCNSEISSSSSTSSSSSSNSSSSTEIMSSSSSSESSSSSLSSTG